MPGQNENAGSKRKRRIEADRPAFALAGYGAATFVLHFVSNEGWWRRRESNYPAVLKTRKLLILLNDRTARIVTLAEVRYTAGTRGTDPGPPIMHPAPTLESPSPVFPGHSGQARNPFDIARAP